MNMNIRHKGRSLMKLSHMSMFKLHRWLTFFILDVYDPVLAQSHVWSKGANSSYEQSKTDFKRCKLHQQSVPNVYWLRLMGD